jgi:hypothetical protein
MNYENWDWDWVCPVQVQDQRIPMPVMANITISFDRPFL